MLNSLYLRIAVFARILPRNAVPWRGAVPGAWNQQAHAAPSPALSRAGACAGPNMYAAGFAKGGELVAMVWLIVAYWGLAVYAILHGLWLIAFLCFVAPSRALGAWSAIGAGIGFLL